MMTSIEVNFPQEDQPSRVKKWKVSAGTTVTAGRILMLYQDVETGQVEKKLKAPQFGRVVKLLVKDNEVVHPSQPVAIMEACTHPTVMKDLCAECGADLREEFAANPNKSSISQANVPMVHSVPELKVTAELAEKIGREDKERLLKHKQLVLLVDLDQTIVHTTNDELPANIANMEDVYHFKLYGAHSLWYHTRLRPHTRNFLSEISKLYELHICTFGARQYAHKVASILDTDGQLFSHRILSRDECFDSQSKTANLKALFPCGVDMVCIIDDRDDVWQGCANLVQVKPYHYFLHTGDIHSPPGLGKHDDPVPQTLKEESDAIQDTNKVSDNSTEKDEEKAIDRDKNSEQKYESLEKSKEIKIETSVDKSENNKNLKSETATASEQISEKTDSSVSAENIKEEIDRNLRKEQEQEERQLLHQEDQDDYLLYLEDILKRIHSEFYDSSENEPRSKTLREIIPRVRSKVLQGLTLTFSGLVPNNLKLHQSRAYKVARAFGANVSQDVTDETTHLVAIQPGTVKVRDAKKKVKVKIVNPDWLWTCAERWEHVDERLYPLKEVPLHKAREFRKPPAHCSTPDHVEEDALKTEDNFANSINPLMTFTQEEIDKMGKEVEEDMSDFDDIEEEEQDEEISRKRQLDSDSDDVYGYDEEYDEPPREKRRRKSSDEDSNSSAEDDERDRQRCYAEDDDEDDPVTRFRRGGDLPDDLDLGDNSQDSVENLEADDMDDEREWNAMGAALEREFMTE